MGLIQPNPLFIPHQNKNRVFRLLYPLLVVFTLKNTALWYNMVPKIRTVLSLTLFHVALDFAFLASFPWQATTAKLVVQNQQVHVCND